MIRLLWPVIALVGWLGVACSSPAANCRSDDDCGTGKICVEGGALFGGGRCIAERYFVDAGATDTTPRDSTAETSDGESDISDLDTGCAVDATRPCYEGPSGTAGVGACERGVERCRADGWSSTCTGQVTPNDYDRCNNQRDDDCDGTVDELAQGGAPCIAGCNCRSNQCVNGVCAHQIFVTDNVYDSFLEGLEGADERCAERAADAGLAGNWKAILSTAAAPARTRLEITAPIYRIDGERIADGADDLWDGEIDTPLALDARGEPVDVDAWTGTTAEGSVAPGTCTEWTSGDDSETGVTGGSQKNDRQWIEGELRRCDEELALYCIDGQ